MAEIADELGCSEMTIYKQLKAFEIPRRDSHGNNTEMYWRDRERLYELYNMEGLSRAEIAERWDTTESTIREWVRKHQLPPQETTA
jgi:transposase